MRRFPRAAWMVLLLACASTARATDVPQDVLDRLAGADLARSADSAMSVARASMLEGVSFAGPVDPDQYRVGPGDQFVLSITGSISRVVTLVVTPEATLTLPAAGSVSVKGLSLTETRARVLAQLRRQYRAVDLDLRLDRPRQFRVTLTGRAARPGVRVVTGGSRLGDVLTPSELLTDASHRGIVLRHLDGSSETVDLGALLGAGDTAHQPYLRDGDIVHVPVATGFMHANGAFATPGTYELAPGDSVSTLVRLAGGVLPSAAAGPALWLHWTTPAHPDSMWLDLSGGDARAFAHRLADGDRLFVRFQPDYHVQHVVSITGEVARPGDYPIEEGRTRLSDVVEQAGGFLPQADLTAVRVRRASGEGEEHDIELERLLRLSRNELTLSEYEALQTRLAARREDYRVDYRRVDRNDGGANLLLRSGDAIRAERLVSSIRVDGQVHRPAILTYRTDLRLDDYLRQAGGLTNRAWYGKIRITRAVSGQTLPANQVQALDPGDFIWVPEKPDVTAWQQVREVLTALAQVATVVIAIRSVK